MRCRASIYHMSQWYVEYRDDGFGFEPFFLKSSLNMVNHIEIFSEPGVLRFKAMNSWPIGYIRKRIGLPGGKENEKEPDRGDLLFAGRPFIYPNIFPGNIP